jgi:hypothetical protein
MISHLPGSSRVWFFGAERLLTDAEKFQLNEKLTDFIAGWKAHGAELSAGFEIIHDVAVVIAVDESKAQASGCSIDKAFKLLQEFEVDFFKRTLIWQPFCNTAKIFTIEQLKQGISAGSVDQHTQIINSLVTHLADARNQLYIPVSASWVYPQL